jgi:hypothetical protein
MKKKILAKLGFATLVAVFSIMGSIAPIPAQAIDCPYQYAMSSWICTFAYIDEADCCHYTASIPGRTCFSYC